MRRATTSWWLSDKFRKHFPRVQFDTEALGLSDGPLPASGGTTAYFDMALWLVGHFASEQLRSLENITGRCGYQNFSTFSKVFKHWTKVTPREYRSRFGLRSQLAHTALREQQAVL